MRKVKQQMPKVPRFSLALIGPGIVLVAMGLGSGEYILWPNLISRYGYGILWGAVAGMTFQYLLSYEVSRYTVASGGSIFTGLAKLSKWLALWFVISSYLSFMWPGIIGSGGKIFAELFGISDYRIPTILMLLIIGMLLTFGGKVYNSLERFQKLVILITMPTLVLIVAWLWDFQSFMALGQGLVGVGEGYTLLPNNVDIPTFLGAIAYSGAAGNLIMSQSFYIQDEKLGMAQHLDTQVDRTRKVKTIPQGEFFDVKDEKQINRFKRWMKTIALEQFISFWIIGLATILLLAYIAYELTYPTGAIVADLNFIFNQANIFNNEYLPLLGTAFLLVGVIFLFKTQLGVFESTSRIMTENMQLFSEPIRKRFSRANIFYFFLWTQIAIAIGITIADFSQPIQILIIGTFFSAVATFGIGVFLLWLYFSKHFPKEIRPGVFKVLSLLLLVIFYGYFVAATVWDVIQNL